MPWPKAKRRLAGGAAIIAAWLVALTLLARREYFQSQLERLAEGASRVAPGAVYYALMQGDRQIGFASSTIDTTETGIVVDDYLLTDTLVNGQPRRVSSRTNVQLTRTLHMTGFEIVREGDGPLEKTSGKVEGDSVLVISSGDSSESSTANSRRVSLTGPVFLSNLLPLAAAIIDAPKVGREYVIPVFDLARMTAGNAYLGVRAESLVVVHDSATFDSTSGRWTGALPDTLHAWRLVADSASGFTGWIDEYGRVVQESRLGVTLRRLPYEVAFVNWRGDSTRAVAPDRNISQPRRPKR